MGLISKLYRNVNKKAKNVVNASLIMSVLCSNLAFSKTPDVPVVDNFNKETVTMVKENKSTVSLEDMTRILSYSSPSYAILHKQNLDSKKTVKKDVKFDSYVDLDKREYEKHFLLESLFIGSVLLYSTAEGFTEGYTWADEHRKEENYAINPSIKNGGNADLDYHAWRTLEGIGIGGAIISGFKIAQNNGDPERFWKLLAGSASVGYFLYESSLNYVTRGDFFADKGNYIIMNWEIPTERMFPAIMGGLGASMLISNFFQ